MPCDICMKPLGAREKIEQNRKDPVAKAQDDDDDVKQGFAAEIDHLTKNIT